MKLTCFSSGSSGNATLIQTGKLNILVDLGITKKAISDNLTLKGLTLNDLSFVLITHDHVDHVKSLPQMLKQDGLRFYMSSGTYDNVRKRFMKDEKLLALLECKMANGFLRLYEKKTNSVLYEPIDVEDTHIEVLPMFHDAPETVGFAFKSDDKLVTYITDTGYVHTQVLPLINNSDLFMLEANHDPSLLMYSSRPYPLKMRILSDHGHLSNEDSMVILVKCMGDKTKTVLHAHVSKECNNSTIIVNTREAVFEQYGLYTENIKFVVLKDSLSEEFEV